jgi:TPR repeat protein
VVACDLVEAAAWFRKSAALGYGVAHFFLARQYAEGEGVPQCLVRAGYHACVAGLARWGEVLLLVHSIFSGRGIPTTISGRLGR